MTAELLSQLYRHLTTIEHKTSEAASLEAFRTFMEKIDKDLSPQKEQHRVAVSIIEHAAHTWEAFRKQMVLEDPAVLSFEHLIEGMIVTERRADLAEYWVDAEV